MSHRRGTAVNITAAYGLMINALTIINVIMLHIGQKTREIGKMATEIT